MKRVGVFLAFIMAFMMVHVALAGQVKIVVNGDILSVNGEVVDGRTLVPIREIAEALNAEVSWNSANHEIRLTKTDSNNNIVKVVMQIGSNIITTNGKADNLYIPPQVVNGKTMVPVRAVSQCFGSETSWDNSSKTVSVTAILSNVNSQYLTMEQVETKNAERDAINRITNTEIQVINNYPEWMPEDDLHDEDIFFTRPVFVGLIESKVGLYKTMYGEGKMLCDLSEFDINKEGVQTVNGIRIKVETPGDDFSDIYFNSDDLVSKGIIS